MHIDKSPVYSFFASLAQLDSAYHKGLLSTHEICLPPGWLTWLNKIRSFLAVPAFCSKSKCSSFIHRNQSAMCCLQFHSRACNESGLWGSSFYVKFLSLFHLWVINPSPLSSSLYSPTVPLLTFATYCSLPMFFWADLCPHLYFHDYVLTIENVFFILRSLAPLVCSLRTKPWPVLELPSDGRKSTEWGLGSSLMGDLGQIFNSLGFVFLAYERRFNDTAGCLPSRPAQFLSWLKAYSFVEWFCSSSAFLNLGWPYACLDQLNVVKQNLRLLSLGLKKPCTSAFSL